MTLHRNSFDCWRLSAVKLSAFFFASTLSFASSANSIDYYSAADLQAQAKQLARDTSKTTNTPTVKRLPAYGTDYTLLVFRNADGQAELHEHESDLYLVVDGTATLVSGGQMNGRKLKSAGEFVGSGITGGRSQELKQGDVVHIAPNLPHQLKVDSGKTFSYFVVKVKEK